MTTIYTDHEYDYNISGYNPDSGYGWGLSVAISFNQHSADDTLVDPTLDDINYAMQQFAAALYSRKPTPAQSGGMGTKATGATDWTLS